MSSVQNIFRKSYIALKFIWNLIFSPKFLNSILIRYEKGELDGFASSVWAQAGEDFAIENILKGQEKGFFIDIGAHHPERFSLTKRLNLKGWVGINVDADSKLIKKFMSDRRLDQNIAAVVGEKSDYNFYEFKERALSTIDESRAKDLILSGRKLIDIRSVKGIQLSEIFKRVPHGVTVDFMNIDIEGGELEALKSGKFEKMKYEDLPNWILIETKPPIKSALEELSVMYLLNIGYVPYLVLAMNTLLRKPSLYEFQRRR